MTPRLLPTDSRSDRNDLGQTDRRRAALVSALATRGIATAGDSGLGVWLPLAGEAAAARELLAQGWAVSPGERYRFRTAPGIRITTANLEPNEAEQLAKAHRGARTPRLVRTRADLNRVECSLVLSARLNGQRPTLRRTSHAASLAEPALNPPVHPSWRLGAAAVAGL